MEDTVRIQRHFPARAHHAHTHAVVTVRGVNEHTRCLMVTWPDGTKGDDDAVGAYTSDKHVYFPLTVVDEEILLRHRQIDEAKKWLETHSVDAKELARRLSPRHSGNEEETQAAMAR